LTESEVASVRALLWDAFGRGEEGMTEDDWQHALGGAHVILEADGALVAHAAVVERELHVGGRPLRTGYVEAVATAPAHHGRGYGRRVMEAVASHIRDNFELGALGTGVQGFYERLGWRIWQGPSSVRTASGEQPTPDEDGYILVLTTPSSPPLDLTAAISCDWREGDVW
jgi:aminoglycoside 2'-N-acetyltransferase I